LSAILVGAGYLALGYFIGSRKNFILSQKFSFSKDKDASLLNDDKKSKQKKNTKPKIKDQLEVEQLADILEDFKMVNLQKVLFFIQITSFILMGCFKNCSFFVDTCC
jgi:peptidyl-tRNA hydrolase, PTH2 family